MTRSGPVALVVALAVAVVVSSMMVAFLRAGTLTPDAQVHAIAAELRCPSCVGESVADSSTPVAEAMRAAIAERVTQGQSRDEILGWFRTAYGPDILLDPAPAGLPVLFWIAPVVLVALAACVAARRRRWRWALGFGFAAALVAVVPLVAPPDRVAGPRDDAPDTVAILTAAAGAEPADADLRRRLAEALSASGDDHGALDAYAAVYRLRSSDAQAASDYAAALLGAGRSEEAALVLERVLVGEPDDRRALLLMATARSRSDDPSAIGLYHRFLDLEPGTPLREAIETEIARLQG